MRVEQFLPTAPQRMCCIDLNAALLQAARLLEHEHDVLVVREEDGRMAGILTKSDVVRQVGICTGASCTAPVVKAMTRDVITAKPKDELIDAWEAMKTHRLKHIPVIDHERKPLGILDVRDVLYSLWQEIRHEESTFIDYVMSVGYR